MFHKLNLKVQLTGLGGRNADVEEPQDRFVVMCQISIACGTFIICEQMTVVPAAEHSRVTVLLALLSLSASIGAAIGNSVSGAIWTNMLLSQLLLRLPDEVQSMAIDIYGDLDMQLSYPMGDPARIVIQEAYGVTQ